jgi:phage terminase large subunit
MELNIRHTNVFTRNFKAYYDNNITTIVNRGGSSSSKTWSILQLLVYICVNEPGVTVDIARQFKSDAKSATLPDLINILRDLDIYNDSSFNKSDLVYTFSNFSKISFIGGDDDNKTRGRRRDILYINEANALDLDIYLQLTARCRRKVFLDYNPSDYEHWLDKVIDNKSSILIWSNYKDNVFLTDVEIEKLNDFVKYDENFYKIYILGEKPISNTRIYTHFKYYEELPKCDDIIYGLDFGFNNETALIKISIFDSGYYCQEVIYKKNLTSGDLIKELNELNIGFVKEIYADPARPEIIEDMRRAGYNVKGAKKEVKEGIDFLKSNAIYLHKESKNLIREYNKYSWKTDRSKKILDEPVKVDDHAMDGIRYGIYTHGKTSNNNFGYYDFTF